MKGKKNTPKKVRLGLQIAVFALVLGIALSKWLSELGIVIPFLPDASLHAVCPFGGVVTTYQFLTAGTFIQKIHSSSFILMLLGFVAALFFGAIFCSHFCPFGSFQEWLGKLGRKLFPKRYNKLVPPRLDSVLRISGMSFCSSSFTRRPQRRP
jgi:polyferredoxin